MVEEDVRVVMNASDRESEGGPGPWTDSIGLMGVGDQALAPNQGSSPVGS